MKDKLLAWLCPDDIRPEKHQAFYRDLRVQGTAQWAFDASQYKKWNESGGFLWISGISKSRP